VKTTDISIFDYFLEIRHLGKLFWKLLGIQITGTLSKMHENY